MQVAAQTLHPCLNFFVQNRIREIRQAQDEPRSLESLNLLLKELKEMYFLCRQDTNARNAVKGLANRTIEIMEVTLLHKLRTLNGVQLIEITRWGLSQKTKNKLLHTAVRNNMPLHIIKHLMRRGADKYQLGAHKRNLLMLAAVHADAATVQYFIDQGLNPRARDDLGNTAARLAILHRHAPPLARLPENIFFPYRWDDSFGCMVFSTALWGWVFDVVTSLLLTENRMILQEIFSVGYTGLLAPLNTLSGEGGERMPSGPPGIVRGGIEGLVSLSYMSHVVGSDSSGIASLVYLALSFLAYKCLDLGTVNKVFIDYIAPLAKCVNVASMVSMVFLSNHPVYAAVNLVLYTISLLDTKGYLPVPIQKVYYCGLRAFQAGLYGVGKTVLYIVAIPITVIGGAFICLWQCICCCRL